MNVIYKLWLTLSSLLLTMTVYLVNQKILVNSLSSHIQNDELKQFIASLPNCVSYVTYFVGVILCTLVSMFLSDLLSTEAISSGSITTVETANDAFLPSYLGYFFVALSISKIDTFAYVFSMIFIFIFFSKISFFNPIFLLFGYKFFHLTNSEGLKIVVITKKELKDPALVEFSNLKRINNYTFITSEKE